MTDPIDPREVRDDNREGRADFREGRADAREGSASRRDERGGNREENAADRDERADQREVGAVVREVDAVDREGRSVEREGRSVEREGSLRGVVRLLVWLTALLMIATGVSIYRSFVVQDVVEHVEDVQSESVDLGSETNQVALDTLTELRAALQQAENGEGTDPEAVADAVAAIHRIEEHLCGGPCPPP